MAKYLLTLSMTLMLTACNVAGTWGFSMVPVTG
jgi:hypothetical protein